MKTIKDFKSILHANEKNTLLGMHLNSLICDRMPIETRADIHDLELKVEIIAQMSKNSIDVFKDSYQLGSVTKAYYQYMLSQYAEY
jgi:hypothetical protein